jgi:hypothetical protein
VAEDVGFRLPPAGLIHGVVIYPFNNYAWMINGCQPYLRVEPAVNGENKPCFSRKLFCKGVENACNAGFPGRGDGLNGAVKVSCMPPGGLLLCGLMVE